MTEEFCNITQSLPIGAEFILGALFGVALVVILDLFVRKGF